MKKILLTIIIFTLFTVMPVRALAMSRVEIIEQIKLIIEQIIVLQEQLLIQLVKEERVIIEEPFMVVEPTIQIIQPEPTPEPIVEPVVEPEYGLTIKRERGCSNGYDCYTFMPVGEEFTIDKMLISSGGTTPINIGQWYNIMGHSIQFWSCLPTDKCSYRGRKYDKGLIVNEEHNLIYFPAGTYITYMRIVGKTSGVVYQCSGSCSGL